MDLTICIPCFNDAANVDGLLHSIYLSDTDGLQYEVLVCDGKSDDDIDDVISTWKTKLPIHLISTHYKASASVNLNAGANCARGEVFCRIDSHCEVTATFLKSGLREFRMRRNHFSALGPSVNVVASRSDKISKEIAKLYMSPFLFGPSKYKRSIFFKKFSGEIGNIYLGFYSTEDVKKFRFAEEIRRKQDIEFLSRLKASKGLGFYNSSEVVINYILKQDRIFPLLGRCFNQGRILVNSISSSRIVHFIPLICALIFFLLVAANVAYVAAFITYLAFSCAFGIVECRSLLGAVLAAALFPLAHLSYVIGNIFGLSSSLVLAVKIKSQEHLDTKPR